MARATITKVTIPSPTSNGYNLTDSADYTVLSTGSGNGVSFAYDTNTTILLKNPTGGAAVFTIVLRPPTTVTAVGGSVVDPTVTVAAAKEHLLKPASVFNQAGDLMFIDCDVAASVLVLATN